MNRKEYFSILALAVLAGLVGGAVSIWAFMEDSVFAQKTIQPSKSIRAERFEVMDSDGKLRIALGLLPLDTAPQGSPSLRLFGKDGKLRAVLDLAPTLNDLPGMAFYDKDGNVVWSTPSIR